MKDKKVCEKTTSGKHLWTVMGGNIPEIARYKVCIACGLVDDVDKTEKK